LALFALYHLKNTFDCFDDQMNAIDARLTLVIGGRVVMTALV
jgi:hypothetical protein